MALTVSLPAFLKETGFLHNDSPAQLPWLQLGSGSGLGFGAPSSGLTPSASTASGSHVYLAPFGGHGEEAGAARSGDSSAGDAGGGGAGGFFIGDPEDMPRATPGVLAAGLVDPWAQPGGGGGGGGGSGGGSAGTPRAGITPPQHESAAERRNRRKHEARPKRVSAPALPTGAGLAAGARNGAPLAEPSPPRADVVSRSSAAAAAATTEWPSSGEEAAVFKRRHVPALVAGDRSVSTQRPARASAAAGQAQHTPPLGVSKTEDSLPARPSSGACRSAEGCACAVGAVRLAGAVDVQPGFGPVAPPGFYVGPALGVFAVMLTQWRGGG
jgi:hypothetical protein